MTINLNNNYHCLISTRASKINHKYTYLRTSDEIIIFFSNYDCADLPAYSCFAGLYRIIR